MIEMIMIQIQLVEKILSRTIMLINRKQISNEVSQSSLLPLLL